MKKNQQTAPDTNTPDAPADASGKGKTTRTGEGKTTMREANENIRKSQDEDGDSVGPHPMIDRHR
ncbi:MAG TPA: hypothetical protein VL243_13150 [Vicinamibacterales bacterium]|jgi:hypothetical protein|nr:hypothetical protein [Vicinamibacterales bacterium]